MRVIIATAGVLLTCEAAHLPTKVSIIVHPESPGIAIPSDFLGLSYGVDTLNSLNRNAAFPAAGAAFRRLVAQLGPGLLRFSAAPGDRFMWIGGQRTSNTRQFALTASDVDRVFNFARLVGWRVLFGLNLDNSSAPADAAETAYLSETPGTFWPVLRLATSRISMQAMASARQTTLWAISFANGIPLPESFTPARRGQSWAVQLAAAISSHGPRRSRRSSPRGLHCSRRHFYPLARLPWLEQARRTARSPSATC